MRPPDADTTEEGDVTSAHAPHLLTSRNRHCRYRRRHSPCGSPGRSQTFTDADWPRFAGDLAGTKYSKLTQINTTNVSRLAAAWTFAGVGTQQQTPIVVAGVMYASTPGGWRSMPMRAR